MHQDGPKVVSKGPCPQCGSKDNLVTYSDGHQFCFTPSCGLVTKATHMADDTTGEAPARLPERAVPFTSEHMRDGLKSRGLKLETLQRFGYFVHKEGGKALQVAPVYNQKGEMAHQKYRDKDKNFWFTPVVDSPQTPRMCQLYGQHVWGEKYDRKVVITTGEHDAHSIAEATQFKVPAVSVLGGDGSALDQLKANYRWLDRFEEIILWFDNDESGQSVVAACADLFEPGKVKTIKVEGIKDANELAQKGRHGDIYAAIWAATTYTPEGIVNAAQCSSDMLEPEAETICPYPFPILQEKTLGIREQEVVYHVAGTGVGKTSIIVELQHALLQAGVKFGVMRFEDTRRKSQLDLMSRHIEDRLHLRPRPPEEMVALHTAVFSGGLVELFDPELAEWSYDALRGYIRYMVKALGCRVIFIDPLSFIVAAVNETDERKALDHVAYEFSRQVKQLRCNLQITHHLNRGDGRAFEEGGEISLKNIRGSAGVANFSMAVFAYERNQQGERPDLTRIRILKNRFSGWTGVADTLKWDEERGVQEATDEPYPDNDNETGKAPPFGPTTGEY
jgi:twinkle protein